MRIFLGLFLFLLTLGGGVAGFSVALLYEGDVFWAFVSGAAGLVLVGFTCGAFYSGMFPSPETCPACGHCLHPNEEDGEEDAA